MICGKTIYATSRDAIEAIKGLMKDNMLKGSKMPSRAYFCDDCQGYHVTTENKKHHIPKSKVPKEIDTTHPNTKRNESGHKTLVIHEARKFKVK